MDVHKQNLTSFDRQHYFISIGNSVTSTEFQIVKDKGAASSWFTDDELDCVLNEIKDTLYTHDPKEDIHVIESDGFLISLKLNKTKSKDHVLLRKNQFIDLGLNTDTFNKGGKYSFFTLLPQKLIVIVAKKEQYDDFHNLTVSNKDVMEATSSEYFKKIDIITHSEKKKKNTLKKILKSSANEEENHNESCVTRSSNKVIAMSLKDKVQAFRREKRPNALLPSKSDELPPHENNRDKEINDPEVATKNEMSQCTITYSSLKSSIGTKDHSSFESSENAIDLGHKHVYKTRGREKISHSSLEASNGARDHASIESTKSAKDLCPITHDHKTRGRERISPTAKKRKLYHNCSIIELAESEEIEDDIPQDNNNNNKDKDNNKDNVNKKLHKLSGSDDDAFADPGFKPKICQKKPSVKFNKKTMKKVKCSSLKGRADKTKRNDKENIPTVGTNNGTKTKKAKTDVSIETTFESENTKKNNRTKSKILKTDMSIKPIETTLAPENSKKSNGMKTKKAKTDMSIETTLEPENGKKKGISMETLLVSKGMSKVRKVHLEDIEPLKMDDLNDDTGDVTIDLEEYGKVCFDELNGIRDLSAEQIRDIVRSLESDIRKIFEGKIPCARHDAYKKGGRERGCLSMQVSFGVLTQEQSEAISNTLIESFCRSHQKYFDYVMKVLLPETMAMVYAKVADITREEANTIIMNF